MDRKPMARLPSARPLNLRLRLSFDRPNAVVKSDCDAHAFLVESELAPERLGGPAVQCESRPLQPGLRPDSRGDVSAHIRCAHPRAPRCRSNTRLARPIESALVLEIQSGGNRLSAPVDDGGSRSAG